MNSVPAGQLVLCWDIDGTLLSTARAGVFAWEDAIKETIGQDVSLQDYATAGLTDVEISRLLVREIAGREDSEMAARMLRRYEALLPSRLHRRTGGVLSGVREVLEYTRGLDGVLTMLLTGNTAAGAKAKLVHYGLSDFFAGAGAFADGCDDRPAIARAALRLAEERLGAVDLERFYVIGDTPHDVHCGKAIGARTVAVATGAYSLAQLAALEPWLALERLPSPGEFLLRLGG